MKMKRSRSESLRVVSSFKRNDLRLTARISPKLKIKSNTTAQIISTWKPYWFSTSLDVLMMIVHSAQERTESDWRGLAKSAGLKVTKIWDFEGSTDRIFELEVAE